MLSMHKEVDYITSTTDVYLCALYSDKAYARQLLQPDLAQLYYQSYDFCAYCENSSLI
jgi:hypothetical protein